MQWDTMELSCRRCRSALPGHAFLLSRPYAGTLIVSLPPRGLEGAISSCFSVFWGLFCVPEVAANAVACARLSLRRVPSQLPPSRSASFNGSTKRQLL